MQTTGIDTRQVYSTVGIVDELNRTPLLELDSVAGHIAPSRRYRIVGVRRHDRRNELQTCLSPLFAGLARRRTAHVHVVMAFGEDGVGV